ncbi:MAG: ABC transporter substrate-binding protein [Christensenellales bacterium]|jgi:putative aldouronate transport system substrate-binding protein
MNKVQRTLALALALVLVAGLLVACSSNTPAASTAPSTAPSAGTDASTAPSQDAEQSAAPQEVVTITYMVMDPSWKPRNWGDDPGTRQMTEKTGTAINFIIPSGDATEKANAMLVANDYPEMMNLGRGTAYMKYIAAGAWYAYDDLWAQYGDTTMRSYMPDPVYKLNLEADGKMYFAPNWFSEDGFGSNGDTLNVRNDIYEALGQPEIKSLDDLTAQLKAVQADAAKYTLAAGKFSPLTINFGNGGKDTGWLNKIVNLWGERAIFNRIIDENNEVKFFTRSPQMVNAIKYINDMYTQGLLDPETFTFNGETRTEAYSQGKHAFAWETFWTFWTPNGTLQLEDPNVYYTSLETPYAVEGVKPMLNGYDTTGNASNEITKNCKNVEAALKWASYYLSDEGNICSFYGAEGETMYYENDDKTQPRLMPGVYEKKLADWDNYGLTTGVRKLDLMQNQKWNWERHAESPDRAANRSIAAASAFDGNLLRILRLDSESEEGRIYAAVEPNIMAELSKIMTGPADQIESSLEAYNKAIDEAGMAKVEAEWTKQYKDYSTR